MDAQTWQTEHFERHRAPLRAIGYRMLGSLTGADDAVRGLIENQLGHAVIAIQCQ